MVQKPSSPKRQPFKRLIKEIFSATFPADDSMMFPAQQVLYTTLLQVFFKFNTCNTFAIDSYHLEGVDVKPNSTVEHVSFSDGQINLRLNSGDEVSN